MSSFVKNLYPVYVRRMSVTIGNGYCHLLTTLLSCLRSLTQWTLPSFLDMINVGEVNSLSCWCFRTPNYGHDILDSRHVLSHRYLPRDQGSRIMRLLEMWGSQPNSVYWDVLRDDQLPQNRSIWVTCGTQIQFPPRDTSLWYNILCIPT